MTVDFQVPARIFAAQRGLRRGAPLAFVLCAVALLASAPAALAECPDGGPAMGQWRFTTRVTSPNGKPARADNGYYTLSVSQSPDCSLAAKLVKTGVTKQRFKAEDLQTGDAMLIPPNADAQPAALASAWILSAELQSASGASEQVEFYLFFSGKSVDGFWRFYGGNWAELGTPGGLLGKAGAGANVAFASTKGLSARTRCLVEECRFGEAGEALCREGYAECAGVAGGAAPRRVSRDWFGSPFAVAAQGAPVRFEGRDARVPCPNAAGEPDGTTCAAYVHLLLEADLIPAFSGPEALVKFVPADDYFGPFEYGSRMLILAVVKGRVTTVASHNFTELGDGDDGLLGEVVVDGGGKVVVKGGYIAPGDNGEPRHTHTSTYEVSPTADGYELKRLSQAISGGDTGDD